MQNNYPAGVALVDVSLLRQTQLRSLSKSDTKLHELQRNRPGDHHLRPVSMDPMHISYRWQIPCAPTTTDATYSNISINVKSPQCTLYESVGSQAEIEDLQVPNPENIVTDEYACVKKVKKLGQKEAQSNNQVGNSLAPPPEPCPVGKPEELRIEDMYSKVKKKKRLVESVENTTESSQVPHLKRIEQSSHWLESAPQLEENVYESICEMTSGVHKTHGNEDGTIITDL
ncbi:lck-interacting transmembrane adapter 1 isoform X2 [Bombina bombina]|nr:lck-interacting transmembrane adapter 1 isoform X2 [Bombina bombina]